MDTEKVTNKYGSYTDYDCYNVFNDDVKYNQFRKYVTENLVVSNLNLNTSTIKALKSMNISGIQAAQIIQLISQVDN